MPEEPVTTTAAALSRNFGLWQDKAMHQPVMVTHHGRPRAVLVSVEAYNKFKAVGASVGIPESEDSVVIDSMSQSFVALDRDFIVRRVNRAATAYFGRPAEALLGRSLTALYPSLQDTARARIFGRVMRMRQNQSFDLPSSIYPDQTIRVDAFPYRGGVGYVFQAISDSEIRRQTAEIEALRALFAIHGSAGMARISLRGAVSRIDDTLLAMAGFDRDALIAMPLPDLVVTEDRPALARALEQVLDGQGAATLSATLRGGRPVTIAIAETREIFAIDGAAVLVTPRAPDHLTD